MSKILSIPSNRIVNAKNLSCRSCWQEGAGNSQWKGGITDNYIKERKTRKCYRWVKAIKKRDNYTCQCCGFKSRSKRGMASHHLWSFDKYKAKRFDLTNGITLCFVCHNLFHKKYGNGSNTPNQFSRFKNERKKFLISR